MTKTPRTASPLVQASGVTYELHSLGWKAFQQLCVSIVSEVWGQSVQSFFDSHDRQRAPGSIGNSSDASRVFKGMRMAGRMGGDRVKMKGLKVVKIFAEKNYILVSGSVPGHNGSIVLINK